MQTITLSIMDHGLGPTEQLMAYLREFESEHHVQVKVNLLSWDVAWEELRNYAIHGNAPDISEVGSTWIYSLANMDVLRPFSQGAASLLDRLIPQLVQVGNVEGQTYGIPYTADFRFLYYRRDLLEKIGVSAEQAFSSLENFHQTVHSLSQPGFPIAWAVPTGRHRQGLHSVCHWVWAHGGDFVTDNGSKVIFASPQALDGFEEYFKLSRHLFGRELDIGISDMHRMFYDGNLALMPSGAWAGKTSMPTKGTDLVKQNYSVTVIPGIPFIGGSHFVLWKTSRQPELAALLAEYLLRPEIQQNAYGLNTSFPVDLGALRHQADAGDVYSSCGLEIVKHGRIFPQARLWGLIEDRLAAEIGAIWDELDRGGPDVAVRPILEQRLPTLERRLNISLQVA